MTERSPQLSFGTTYRGDVAIVAEKGRPRAERLDWIDQARGIGIILVVVGHALRGLVASGILGQGPLVVAIDRAIYAFHMPLFFLLAGLTFMPGAARQPLGRFVANRAQRLLWPLCLWTWLFVGMQIAAGTFSNAQIGWSDFPIVPLPPRDQFWFLWALFLILMVGVLAVRWRVWGAISAAVLVVGGIVLWQRHPDLSAYLRAALVHLPFFAAGIAWWSFAPDPCRPGTRGRLSTVALGAVLFALPVAWAASGQAPHGEAGSLLISMSAVIGLALVFSARPAFGWVGAVLRRLGQASMAIFLAHTIFTGGVRSLLIVVGVSDPAIYLILGILAGILGPLLLADMARRMGWTRLLGF